MKDFELAVRAIIIDGDRILLCRAKKRDYYFFPGGHVEFGEQAEEALRREIREELGVGSEAIEFIGAAQNIFEEGGEKHHEINFVFTVSVDKDQMFFGEDHIEFEWKSVDALGQSKVLPEALARKLQQWIKDKKIFWASRT